MERPELQQSEKAPIDIGENIPKFVLDKTNEAQKVDHAPPPLINEGNVVKTPKKKTPNTVRDNVRNILDERKSSEQNLSSLLSRQTRPNTPSSSNNMQSKMFILTSTQKGAKAAEEETFLSSRYAPFGRLLDCKLVNTLESNIDGTPLIAMVIKDLWWTNANGERKLIIPAGTEVHGKMGSTVRNRMTSDGNFILVWQITSGQVGMELQLQGRVLEKSNQAGDKAKATITDMAAGIPGRIMGNGNLNEMLQYTMAFARGLSEGFETTKTFDNGSTIVTENDGSTQNALAKAFENLSNIALENITDKISKESYYIRIPAGTEFYLYIEQVTDIEKAAIADTVLNNLEQLKLNQKTNGSSDDTSVEKASKLHDALSGALPKNIMKGIY